MTIRAGGLASGLDTNSIIDQLVALEKRPITLIEGKKSNVNNQISILGKIRSAFTKVQDKLKAIDTVAELASYKATSSSEDAFTAKAEGGATRGNYDVTVSTLAKAAKMRSVGVPNATPQLRGGSLSISIRGADPVEFEIVENETLVDLADRFNKTIEGATAAVVNDGTNSYLSITADKTGYTVGQAASSALSITETYTGAFGTALGLTTTQSAVNASLTLDGLPVVSETNDVTTAISGVTLSLKAPTTKAETLTVAGDPDTLKTRVKDFVDAFNEAVDLVTKETTVVETSDRERTLAGDPAVRGLRSELSSMVSQAVSSLSGTAFDNIAGVGVKTSRSGRLEFDDAAFKAAVTKDPMAVVRLFTNSDGLAQRITAGLERYTGPDGVLKARTKGLNDQLTSFDKRIDDLNLRVDRYESQLVRQFGALESAAQNWTQQGNYLASALGS